MNVTSLRSDRKLQRLNGSKFSTRMVLVLICLLLIGIPAVAQSPTRTLSLDDLIQAGWNDSPQMRQARLNASAALIQRTSARSQFFPEITAQAGVTWLEDPPAGVVIPAGAFGGGQPLQNVQLAPGGNDWNYQATLRLQQPVFAWGKILGGLRISQHELAISSLELEKTRKEVTRDITKAFGLAHFSQQALQQARVLGTILEEIFQDRQRSFQVGAVNREEVLEAQLRLREVESQIIEAELTALIALEQLSILTGIQSISYDRLAPPQSLDGIQIPDLQQFIDLSVSQSQEIQMLGLRLQQAIELAKIEGRSRGLLPDLGLTVELSMRGTEFPGVSDWRDSWSTNLSVTLGTQITLFDGGRQLAKIREQALQAQRVGQGINDRALTLSLEIIRAYEAKVRAERRMLNTQAKLEFITEQERNARVSFENDLITREQVLGARVMLLTTQLELAAAEFEYQSALADLAFFIPNHIQ
jgi:outer membrane protein